MTEVEAGTAKGDVTVVELSKAQQLMVRRTAEAKATIPELVVTMEVDMEASAREHGAEAVRDLAISATALALREFPRANGAYRDGRLELYSRVNIGIVVDAPDRPAIPTIFDADRKTLAEIAEESRGLAAKVRDGSIAPPELSGGTFTVSSLADHGVTAFQAVINQPQAGILAIGALAPDHRLVLTLTADHRILYGSEAARFLARIKHLLQTPSGAGGLRTCFETGVPNHFETGSQRAR